MKMKKEVAMKVEDLCLKLKTSQREVPVVNSVSFNLYEGQVLGLIGESGSGKSMTCLALMELLDREKWRVEGSVYIKGEKLHYNNKEQIRRLRGNKMAMIMQNPIGSFNPLFTIGEHFIETIRLHKSVTKKEAKELAIETMLKVNLLEPEKIMAKYPFQLSGGMLQRIMIAIAIFMRPSVMIADEPTTSLDVTVQYQILAELTYMKDYSKSAMLLVSHDLGVIAQMADEVAVMYSGHIVEKASAVEIFNNPLHPYTRALMKSRPSFTKERLKVLEGQPPSIMGLNSGCPFADRCACVQGECYEYDMCSYSVSEVHSVKCLAYSSKREVESYECS